MTMSIEQIAHSQFVLSESKQENPELKQAVQGACSRWAENSRKYGVIPLTKRFHKGR